MTEVSTLGTSGLKSFAKKHKYSVKSKKSGGRVPLMYLSKDGKDFGPFDPTITTRRFLLKKLGLKEVAPKGWEGTVKAMKKEKDIDVDQIEKVIKVNFFGTLNCIKTVELYFKGKKSGHISIVSSVAGYRGLPNSTGYGASKAALNNLAESLYFDFGRHNVRVSLVSPGFIKTPMTDKNQFRMPFLKTAEFAAEKIYNGLVNGSSFEIDFPKELTLILKLLKILPNRLYLYLIKKLTKLQKL